MGATGSPRAQAVAGVAVGLALAVGLAGLKASRESAAESARHDARAAVVALGGATAVAERAGAGGDVLRSAIAALADRMPDLRSIRIVLIDGYALEASTAAADTGDRAAPRRLERDEKPLLDQAQRIRAALENNRQASGPRKEVLETERLPGGVVAAAGPLERDGTVVGMVRVEASALAPAPRSSWGPAAFAGLLGLLAFAAIAWAAGPRRVLLAAAGVAVIAVALLGYGRRTLAEEAAGRLRTEQAVATAVKSTASAVEGALEKAGLETSGLRPTAWDSDPYGDPRGFVREPGKVDRAAVDASTSRLSRDTVRAFVGAGIAGAILSLLFSLGFASRLFRTGVRYRSAYAYALPAMIGMLVLVFLPFSYGVALSFTNSNIYNTNEPIAQTWVGLDNFENILGDLHIAHRTPDGWEFDYHNFYWTLLFTVIWTVTNVALGVSLGLVLALILHTKGLRLRPIYRVLLILPWAMPNYITALIWKGMFHQQFGVVNQVIQMFGGTPVSWFETPFTSFLTVLATNGWLSFPFMMVVALGALQSIPADLYEAARVDGATRWQQFRFVTMPSLKPAMIPAIILSVIWTFNMFNIIYLVSQGEPGGSTEIFITESYKIAFEQYRYGYAAAYSTVIFVILLAYGIWQNRVTRATEGI